MTAKATSRSCVPLLLVLSFFTNTVLVRDTPAQCAPPPSGLVNWWPGDGNANDIAGSNNGTLQNGVTFAPGKVGSAFNFDGVDDFVNVPDTASLDAITSAITFEAWVTPDAGGWVFGYRDPLVSEGFSVGLGTHFHIESP